jgi:hypothetical protein
MNLIKDILILRIDQYKDLELNNERIKSIWHFYQVYHLCLNIVGLEDKKLTKKMKLIRKLIINREDNKLLNKIKSNIYEDNRIIESVLNGLNDVEEKEDLYEDFYPTYLIAVNLDDRDL